MALLLRVLVALPEEDGSISTVHVGQLASACNSSGSSAPYWSLRTPAIRWHTHIQTYKSMPYF